MYNPAYYYNRENKIVLTLLKRQFLLEVDQAWSCLTLQVWST